jgi:hypothetical protein
MSTYQTVSILFKILGPAERVYHLLENLGRLRVLLREAPLSMYPPLLFSSSSSLDSSLLHLDPPLPAATSSTEDFLPKLQIREITWLFFEHFIHQCIAHPCLPDKKELSR